jgi:hypothetical protein
VLALEFDFIDRMRAVFLGILSHHPSLHFSSNLVNDLFEKADHAMLGYIPPAVDSGWLDKGFTGWIEFEDGISHMLTRNPIVTPVNILPPLLKFWKLLDLKITKDIFGIFTHKSTRFFYQFAPYSGGGTIHCP